MELGQETNSVIGSGEGTPVRSAKFRSIFTGSRSTEADRLKARSATSVNQVRVKDQPEETSVMDPASPLPTADKPKSEPGIAEKDSSDTPRTAISGPRLADDDDIFGDDNTEVPLQAGSQVERFFDQAADLDTEVEMILNHPDLLKDEQLEDLQTILSHYLPETIKYGADFDFNAEISAQIAAVRAMRDRVMTPSGKLKDSIPIREAKETLAAGTTLLNTLMKNHEKVVNFNRQRAIEEATLEAVKGLPEENQQIFMTALETLLSRIE